MCDYSLNQVASRPAVIGDRLVTHNFGTGTTGFRALGEPSAVAVCLLPGTELSFESRPLRLGENHWQEGVGKPLSNVATFRQINKQHERVHHDALEFSPQGEEFSPQGETVLLTTLREGQRATVLQLPATPKTDAEREEQRRAEFAG